MSFFSRKVRVYKFFRNTPAHQVEKEMTFKGKFQAFLKAYAVAHPFLIVPRPRLFIDIHLVIGGIRTIAEWGLVAQTDVRTIFRPLTNHVYVRTSFLGIANLNLTLGRPQECIY